MRSRDGYTWIIQGGSYDPELNINNFNGVDYSGIFKISVLEGQGSLYESFLKMWNDPLYQNM